MKITKTMLELLTIYIWLKIKKSLMMEVCPTSLPHIMNESTFSENKILVPTTRSNFIYSS